MSEREPSPDGEGFDSASEGADPSEGSDSASTEETDPTSTEETDPTCPECGEPVGATAERCIHCHTEFGDGGELGLDPEGEAIIVRVAGVAAGLIAGAALIAAFTGLFGPSEGVPLGLLGGLAVGVQVARQPSVDDGMRWGGLLVVGSLLVAPFAALNPAVGPGAAVDSTFALALFVTLVAAFLAPFALSPLAKGRLFD